jgi:hypothetical protein
MSFDPFGHQPEPQAPAPPAAGASSVNADAAFVAAGERVVFPAMMLMATSLLNLVAGGAFGFVGYSITRVPKDQLERQMRQQQPARWEELQKEMKKQGKTLDDVLAVYSSGFYGWSALSVIVALLGLVAGFRMLALRNYGLVVLGTLTTAFPCISPMSCPCGIGMLVGFWCLALLVNADIRAAFR